MNNDDTTTLNKSIKVQRWLKNKIRKLDTRVKELEEENSKLKKKIKVTTGIARHVLANTLCESCIDRDECERNSVECLDEVLDQIAKEKK